MSAFLRLTAPEGASPTEERREEEGEDGRHVPSGAHSFHSFLTSRAPCLPYPT